MLFSYTRLARLCWKSFCKTYCRTLCKSFAMNSAIRNKTSCKGSAMIRFTETLSCISFVYLNAREFVNSRLKSFPCSLRHTLKQSLFAVIKKFTISCLFYFTRGVLMKLCLWDLFAKYLWSNRKSYMKIW